MTTFNHLANESLTSLVTTLNCYIEAGVDPAFDPGMEELERQFAELRLTYNRN